MEEGTTKHSDQPGELLATTGHKEENKGCCSGMVQLAKKDTTLEDKTDSCHKVVRSADATHLEARAKGSSPISTVVRCRIFVPTG